MCKSVLNFSLQKEIVFTLKCVGRVGHCNVDLSILSFPAVFLLLFATTAAWEHTQQQCGIVAFL